LSPKNTVLTLLTGLARIPGSSWGPLGGPLTQERHANIFRWAKFRPPLHLPFHPRVTVPSFPLPYISLPLEIGPLIQLVVWGAL